MKRIFGIIIASLLLAYGVIRIGVGTALLAQSFDVIAFPDLAEGVAEIKAFIDARVLDQWIPFSVSGYLAYILVMGLFLTVGSIGVILRSSLGFKGLLVYLFMHASLFVNFQEANPKLFVLLAQALMLGLLFYLIPPMAKTTKAGPTSDGQSS